MCLCWCWCIGVNVILGYWTGHDLMDGHSDIFPHSSRLEPLIFLYRQYKFDTKSHPSLFFIFFFIFLFRLSAAWKGEKKKRRVISNASPSAADASSQAAGCKGAERLTVRSTTMTQLLHSWKMPIRKARQHIEKKSTSFKINQFTIIKSAK